jgi:hypothetical protein
MGVPYPASAAGSVEPNRRQVDEADQRSGNRFKRSYAVQAVRCDSGRLHALQWL